MTASGHPITNKYLWALEVMHFLSKSEDLGSQTQTPPKAGGVEDIRNPSLLVEKWESEQEIHRSSWAAILTCAMTNKGPCPKQGGE